VEQSLKMTESSSPICISLFPRPIFADSALTARVHAGTINAHYKSRGVSQARYRYIVVENHSAAWLNIVVSCGMDGPWPRGCVVASGSAGHIPICYAYFQEECDGVGFTLEPSANTRGELKVYSRENAPELDSGAQLPEATLAGLGRQRPTHHFDFDLTCFEGTPGSKVF
jgi:hypothetical protein